MAPLILALFVAYGCAEIPSFSGLQTPASRVAYPDSDTGFLIFINDLIKSNLQNGGVQTRMHALLIPNSSAAFIKLFGPTTGPTLDFQYRYQLAYQFARLYSYLPIYGAGANHLVAVEHCERGNLSPFVADSELIPLAEQPLRIYSASIATNKSGPWLKVGSFVYLDGNYRYLGSLGIAMDWQSFYYAYDKPFEP